MPFQCILILTQRNIYDVVFPSHCLNEADLAIKNIERGGGNHEPGHWHQRDRQGHPSLPDSRHTSGCVLALRRS